MAKVGVCGIENLDDKHRKIALAVFPDDSVKDSAAYEKTVKKFAEILGVGADYLRFCKLQDLDDDFCDLLDRFQNNLSLLISKTWVEECDDIRKEKLRSKLPAFLNFISNSDYKNAICKFGDILAELSFLFFGDQIFQNDFIEYTLRIDTQMGLFWWYSTKLKQINVNDNSQCLRSLLIIGLCYLANF
ncbi:MAG: hypothetical protein Ta2B_02970 [Termitinemataceae bacterium]|nr:MAG: hypothetical protein Ta2B_02970 [Termitinemataceae bacterium]